VAYVYDVAFVYLDGRIVCDLGGVRGDSSGTGTGRSVPLAWWFRGPPYCEATTAADFGTINHTKKHHPLCYLSSAPKH
jgi:hypothetical protein